jgi:hypothetical protein
MTDTIIKPEPEDTEDLIMSYLNTDYLSTESPFSPCSSSDVSSPPTDAAFFGTTPFPPHLDCWPQLQQDPLSVFPFLLPLNSAFPPLIEQYTQPSPPSSASSASSLSDSDQPKKKRGRKKRDNSQSQNMAIPTPKPLAPRPLSTLPIKMEAVNTETQQEPNPSAPIPSQEAQKAAQLAKRQERLIKNRAAALLSRKRKREHLFSLEDEKKQLEVEKDDLQLKVEQLEARVQSLEKENFELKQKLQPSPTTTDKNIIKPALPKNSKASGIVFMV